MKENKIVVQPRVECGKGAARKLRAAGLIPGVVYGEGAAPTLVAVARKDLSKLVGKSSGKSFLIDLLIGSDTGARKVLIKEIQTDPLDSRFVSIDFQQVSLTKKIHISVPIVLNGIPEGVKSMGGILEFIQRELEVSCLPTEIPEKFEVDVSALKIGENIHAGQLTLPGITVVTPPQVVIATVVAPTVTKEAEAAPAAAAEGEAVPAEAAAEGEAKEGAEPEVITEKKERKEKGREEKEK